MKEQTPVQASTARDHAEKPGTASALITESSSHPRITQPVDPAVAEEVDWQRLWLATQRSSWSSLGVIPIGEGIETPRIAVALASVGQRHLGGIIVAWDLTNVTLTSLEAELSALTESARCGERAIVALPPLLASPACLEVARACDAALLCVTLGSSAIAEAERVTQDLGTDRIVGSVLIRKRRERK